MLDIDRERNIEILRQACFAYDKANSQLLEKIRQLTQELADAQGLDASQVDLDLPDVHFEVKAPEKQQSKSPRESKPKDPPKRQTGHGPTQQTDLPIDPVPHIYDRLPDCPACKGTMELWKGQFETSEEITVVETSYRILLHQRQKYRCRCNGQVCTAPGPLKLIPGGRYSIDFAVQSAISKFCDHQPLERQVRMMARHGLVVTSQTLWDQHAALAKHLEPTWKALCCEALAEVVLHVDETGWRMMGSKTNPKWALFGLSSPRVAAYHLVGSKSAATARKILKGFRGTLVVDGFVIYPIVADLEKNIQIAHCWAHADRKFKDAKDPPRSIGEIRSLIAKLYAIEREIEGPFPGDAAACAQRLALRQEKSAPIVQEIRNWAFSQRGLKRSNFGKAVRYMLKHWDGLTVFLKNSRVPLDNNAAERVLRGPVLGRKNFYGNRSRRGAKVAAILYSLIETAKLNGTNPAALLRQAARTAIKSPGAVVVPR